MALQPHPMPCDEGCKDEPWWIPFEWIAQYRLESDEDQWDKDRRHCYGNVMKITDKDEDVKWHKDGWQRKTSSQVR